MIHEGEPAQFTMGTCRRPPTTGLLFTAAFVVHGEAFYFPTARARAHSAPPPAPNNEAVRPACSHRAPLSSLKGPRAGPLMMQLECSEENVEAVLEEFVSRAETMFGTHEAAQRIGITGTLRLHSLDGPVVLLQLSGRFWHKRVNVLANARRYLMYAIPELSDVDVFDPDNLLDTVVDEETGDILEDRRSPDWNGDREALAYQGIDPDTRGPFPNAQGGFRPGGSMLS